MSVSIKEVLEDAGYNLDSKEDARWFLSRVNEIEELIVSAEDLLEN